MGTFFNNLIASLGPMYGVIIGGLMALIFGLVALYIDRRHRSKHP